MLQGRKGPWVQRVHKDHKALPVQWDLQERKGPKGRPAQPAHRVPRDRKEHRAAMERMERTVPTEWMERPC